MAEVRKSIRTLLRTCSNHHVLHSQVYHGKHNQIFENLEKSLSHVSSEKEKKTRDIARGLLSEARLFQMDYTSMLEKVFERLRKTEEKFQQEQQELSEKEKEENRESVRQESQGRYGQMERKEMLPHEILTTPIIVAWFNEDSALETVSVDLWTAPHGNGGDIPLISPEGIKKLEEEEDLYLKVPKPRVGRFGTSDVLLIADQSLFDDSLLMLKLNVDVARSAPWKDVNILERSHDAPPTYSVHYKGRVKNPTSTKYSQVPQIKTFNMFDQGKYTITRSDLNMTSAIAEDVLSSCFQLHAYDGHTGKTVKRINKTTGEITHPFEGYFACIVLGRDENDRIVPHQLKLPYDRPGGTTGSFYLKTKEALTTMLQIAFNSDEDFDKKVEESVLYIGKFSKMNVLFACSVKDMDPLLIYKLNLESSERDKTELFWVRMHDKHIVGKSSPSISLQMAAVLIPSIYKPAQKKRKEEGAGAGPSEPKKRSAAGGKKKKAEVKAQLDRCTNGLNAAVDAAMLKNGQVILGSFIKSFIQNVCCKSIDVSLDHATNIYTLLAVYTKLDPEKVFDVFSSTAFLVELQKSSGIEDNDAIARIETQLKQNA